MSTGTMHLTILGNGPVSPNPGGACSGYLVQSAGASLLLDCGTGVAATPALKAALPSLDAVLLSHLHIDHWIDLVPLAYELKYAPHTPRREPLAVWVPPGSKQTFLDLCRALTLGSHHAEEVFRVSEYDEHSSLNINDAKVSFRLVEHFVPAYSMRVEAGGRSLVYSGDSTACEALTALADEADLFLCEATDPIDKHLGKPRGHMNALEAGQIAARARVRQLLLTHMWHHYDSGVLLRAAESTYPGPCALAEQGRSYEVS